MKIRRPKDKTMFGFGEIECWNCMKFAECNIKKEGYAVRCHFFEREERTSIVEKNRQKLKARF